MRYNFKKTNVYGPHGESFTEAKISIILRDYNAKTKFEGPKSWI